MTIVDVLHTMDDSFLVHDRATSGRVHEATIVACGRVRRARRWLMR